MFNHVFDLTTMISSLKMESENKVFKIIFMNYKYVILSVSALLNDELLCHFVLTI